jgi:hypothetical protein
MAHVWVVEVRRSGRPEWRFAHGFETRKEARDWAAHYGKSNPIYRYCVSRYTRDEPKRRAKR